jgi:hypothetical protein
MLHAIIRSWSHRLGLSNCKWSTVSEQAANGRQRSVTDARYLFPTPRSLRCRIRIHHEGKQMYFGTYTTRDRAREARDRKLAELGRTSELGQAAA